MRAALLSGMQRDAITALLNDAAAEIARSCGHGRLRRSTFANGTVRVVVTLDNLNARTRADAEYAVYSRLSRAGVPCQVAVS
jgi:hypothetical protein